MNLGPEGDVTIRRTTNGWIIQQLEHADDDEFGRPVLMPRVWVIEETDDMPDERRRVQYDARALLLLLWDLVGPMMPHKTTLLIQVVDRNDDRLFDEVPLDAA